MVVCSIHKNNKSQNVWGSQLQTFFLKYEKKIVKESIDRLVVRGLVGSMFVVGFLQAYGSHCVGLRVVSKDINLHFR